MCFFEIVSIALMFFSPSDFDTSLSVELLIQKLSSKSELDHAIARQLLSLKNPVVVVPKILPFLESEDPDIKGTTRNILIDLANDSKKWGGDVRKNLSHILIESFLDSKRSTSAREDILKALIFTVDDEVDLLPLKEYLINEEWREKIRTALVEANTKPAKSLLCDSLDVLDDKAKSAILLGLYQLDGVPCEEKVISLLSSSNPELRASAVLSLSNTPSPIYAEKIFQVCVLEPEISDYYQQNWDSLLRITERILQTGGNWSYAINLYKKILAFSKSQSIVCSAIFGLGRYGDDSVAEFLSELVITSEGEKKKCAMCALSQISSKGIADKLLNLCGRLSLEEQAMLLPGLLRENNREINETVINILSTPIGKEKFINSFWEEPNCNYLNYLTYLDKDITEIQRNKIIQSLWKYVSTNTEENQECKGKAYMLLYKMAPPDEKPYAMSGLKKFPITEVTQDLLQDILKEGYDSLPFPLLFELYGALPNEDERKGRLKGLLISQIKESSLELILSIVSESKYLDNFPSLAGFITSWKLIGPFPWSFGEGIDSDYGVLNAVEGNKGVEFRGKRFEWKSVKTEGWGYVNLMHLCEGKDEECSNICAFALANIKITEAQESYLLLGSDDGYRLWVNGELIDAKNVDRGMKVDEEKLPIKLLPGSNKILLQITQIRGGWNFCARLVDKENKPLKFEMEGN
ncbi:MAG: hypothetical protein N3G21_12150 [Candidatus Hydrogenedentes bacterium]|nr:hypothetical protein [Candidatus Hydrogenedentota bacterium]